jgi:hypothetical protein
MDPERHGSGKQWEDHMTGSGSWIGYSGSAEIVLAVVLATAAAAVAWAGAWLPLPARLPIPGRTAKITLLAAWVLAIVALLVCVAVYLTQVGRDGLTHTPRADSITPVTLVGVAVVFFAIAGAQRAGGWRVALGSAMEGAVAAPMIFELPFDLIIMPRSHPLVDPALYRPLLFGTLILVGITTVALVSMSPTAQVRRATLWCFAGMLALFALWGLLGFSYPSALGPTALNTLSKILAFVTAVTLFLPQQPALGVAPPTDSNDQAQPVLPRRRPLAGAVCGALAMALAGTGCSSAGRPAGAPTSAPGAAVGSAWLCQPGQAADPCTYSGGTGPAWVYHVDPTS